MKKRKLAPYTIIPEDLYVNRSADHQLKQVVMEGGRPGYVLVARQMGKTNLLLNLKRVIENEGTFVLYLDLSNRISTLRAWFRYLIDSLCETFDDHLYDIEGKIRERREARKLEPSIEFDRELRLLLKALPGKLVIILDEIDSLTGADFSDLIFAQVRSMYFNRANHSIYENLTYVLSGVAEPTELIKNKDISPFNIGEKIYLSDFSYDEVCELLSKANLSLSEQVIKRIFFWVNGNPRMTWDLCSNIEGVKINGRNVDIETVDNCVEELYLKECDIPPVDHIRTLVERDPQVRNAITQIKYGKGSELDERTVSKLYLAGIISSHIQDERTHIKNEVIDRVLSQKWLDSLSASSNDSLSNAQEYFKARNFASAVALFRDFLETNDCDDCLTETQWFNYGESLFFTSNFSEALSAYIKCIELTSDKDFATTCQYKMGQCSFYLGNYSKCLPSFEKAKENSSGFIHYNSSILISVAKIKVDSDSNKDKVLIVNNNLLDTISNDPQLDEVDRKDLSSVILYNNAAIYSADGKNEKAITELNKAFENARSKYKPSICIALMNLNSSSITEKLQETVENVVSDRIDIVKEDITQLAFSWERAVKFLCYLSSKKLFTETKQLIEYIENTQISKSKTFLEHTNKILDGDTVDYITETKDFLSYVLDLHFDNGFWLEDKKSIYHLLPYAISVASKPKISHIELYLEYVEKDLKYKTNSVQTLTLTNILQISEQISSSAVLSKTATIANRVIDKNVADIQILTLLFYLTNYTSKIGDKGRAYELAQKLLELSKEQLPLTTGVNRDSVGSFKRFALQLISKFNKEKKTTKIPRNQMVTVEYKNGEKVTQKFKLIEQSLINKECRLIKIETDTP
ncbi:AAA-like domain-containing protein [Terasakiella pusilla]|uniref:AAA-like domain-containing protein n=1 Tax=Terasakiella pusilla TaxID=64973 RepID=UPI003AA9A513